MVQASRSTPRFSGLSANAAIVFSVSASLCLRGEVLPQPVNKVEWNPVEEGVADRTSISRSLKIEPLELRRDTSFERVYEVGGDVRLFGGKRLLARRAGDTTAIFPQSQYAETQRGLYAVRPGGTVFLIGEPSPRDLGVAEPTAESIMHVDLSADLRPGAQPPRAMPKPEGPPTIWTDERHRVQRVRALISIASAYR